MSTVYISPTGAGDKSGSSIANAATLGSLNGMIKAAGPGGTVALVADKGSYTYTGTLNITNGGKDGASVTIKGVSSSGADMNVQIDGSRPAVYAANNASGNELFKLLGGASNLNFENISVSNVGTAFRVGANIANLSIEDVKAKNVGSFLSDLASGSATDATISGLTVRDVEVVGFSKTVIRLAYDTHDVLIENVRGDSQGQDDGDFAIGVHATGTAHDIVIRNTTMENAKESTASSYWNGDGFATERGVYNVLFEDTVARGNADGGYDLKSTATTLVRTVAEDNARNYRIWGEATMIDAVALDPHLRGGSSTQVQVWVASGGKLTIDGGVIADSGSKTRVFDNSGTITLVDTDIVYAANAILSTANKPLGMATSDITKVLTSGLFSTLSDTTATVADLLDTLLSVPTATEQAPAPVPAPIPVPAPPPPAPTIVLHTSSSASETWAGSSARDIFDFTATGKQGTDTLKDFGADDLILFKTALKDGNKDGLIGFGSNGVLDIGAGLGSIKSADLSSGLRFLGKTSEGYAYGDAAIRPKGALEGKLEANDTLAGDKGDKKISTFFFDTALHQSLGDDRITQFGAKDVVITTSLIGDGKVGAHITADNGQFALFDEGADIGGVTVTDGKGAAVTALEYDGSHSIDGVTYFVYSAIGSATDMAAIFG